MFANKVFGVSRYIPTPTIALLAAILSISSITTRAQEKSYAAIYSGIPWFDNRGIAVSAHGANIIKENGRFFLFGEAHDDSSNAFSGFNCYSSTDLRNWRFESVALPVQVSGKLGPNRIGERCKVMKCPSTGEYVMYMHADTLGYTDQFVGYAVAKKITGPYVFQGPLLFNGKPIRKWDMGSFQDKDGGGYILLHGGDIYKLHDDFKSISEQVNKAMTTGFESPALFRRGNLYYFLGSDLTGWERNNNYYFTAVSLSGPWTRRGFIAPAGTLTWNSQTTFVLSVVGTKKTTYMFMGDRWSYPRQATAATYVWQPLDFSGDSILLPKYHESWKINTSSGVVTNKDIELKQIPVSDSRISWTGVWSQDTLSVRTSDQKWAKFSFKIKTTQIGFYGLARPGGGYAQVIISDSKGNIIIRSIVDMYSKYPVSTLKFLSPRLPKDEYTMNVSVMGERWYWVEKSGRRSGSSNHTVSLDKIVFRD